MRDGKDIVSIAAFFGKDYIEPNPTWPAMAKLKAANIVFGVDMTSEREFLVYEGYGRQTFERFANMVESEFDQEPGVLEISLARRVLYIEIDQEVGALEQLLALMQTVKGRDDYQSGDDQTR